VLGTIELRFPDNALEVGRERVLDKPMLEGLVLKVDTFDLPLAFDSS